MNHVYYIQFSTTMGHRRYMIRFIRLIGLLKQRLVVSPGIRF